jgi:hypothetical protein
MSRVTVQTSRHQFFRDHQPHWFWIASVHIDGRSAVGAVSEGFTKSEAVAGAQPVVDFLVQAMAAGLTKVDVPVGGGTRLDVRLSARSEVTA